MSQRLNKFTRAEPTQSGRWKRIVDGVFPPKIQPNLSNSEFYVDIDKDNDSFNLISESSESTYETSNENSDPQPSTSKEKCVSNKDGTLPFIDERTFTINGFQNEPFPAPKLQKSSSSSKKRNKTEIEDKLMAKDLLIDELRMDLNVLSAENQELTVQKSEFAEELCKQVAENLSLIEKNEHLRQENENFIKTLHQKFETHQESLFPECRICMVEKPNFAFYRCGHVCLCNICADTWKSNNSHCLVCRQPFEEIIRVYI